MPSIHEAKAQYPGATFHPILITEVTRMREGRYCVAGWDLHAARIVRPIPLDGWNWKFAEKRPRWTPGDLLDIGAVSNTPRNLPHSREDVVLRRSPVRLEKWDSSCVYRELLCFASPSISRAFGMPLIEDKFVGEDTDCPSLVSVRISRNRIEFEESLDRLRLCIEDKDGRKYVLPVTSDDMLGAFGPKDSKYGIGAANTWLCATDPEAEIILRMGLARAWAGKEDNWYPRRCYLQVNGLVCPESSYDILESRSLPL